MNENTDPCPKCGKTTLRETGPMIFVCDSCEAFFVQDKEVEVVTSPPRVKIITVHYPQRGFSEWQVRTTIGPKNKEYDHDFQFNEKYFKTCPATAAEIIAQELQDWMDTIVDFHREKLEPSVAYELGKKIDELTGVEEFKPEEENESN